MVAGGDVLSAEVKNVVSVEAGYAYILSARYVDPDGPHGLLFNLIKQDNLDGYAFGHHTRLGIGRVYNVSDKHKVTLKGAYNFVTFPYFDLSDARITFPSVALRYYFYYCFAEPPAIRGLLPYV